MILAVIGLLAPIAAAWMWLAALHVTDSPAIRGALAFACGLGLSSITTMALVASGIGLGPGAMALDLVLWTALAIAGWRRLRQRSIPVWPTRARRPPLTLVDWGVRLAFGATAAFAFGTIVTEYVLAPHGQWDAWAIWNQKARFLLRGGDAWTGLLEIDWSNPGHPLLLPASVARLWAYAGSELTILPAAISVLFGASGLAVVMGALDPRLPRAWMAGTVLLVPGSFVSQTVAQQADIPVALYIVSTLALLQRAAGADDSGHRRWASVLLAGLLGGLAAWTKNEGFLLLAVSAPLVAWIAFRYRSAWPAAWWAIGVLGPLLVVLWFKLVVAPVTPVYLAQDDSSGTLLDQLVQPERHALIGDIVTTRGWLWGGPSAKGLLPAILAAAALVSLWGGAATRLVFAAIVLMCGGYYAVYVFTSMDLAWLVSGTIDRLTAQLWPSIVLAAFSLVRSESPG